ncbi:UNVERIFIED_CONTAM: hypothetical protein FKN15_010040 [Acipenser sinensis]
MCSDSRSSCLAAQCRSILVVNWSSVWQGRLRTIFTISSLGLARSETRRIKQSREYNITGKTSGRVRVEVSLVQLNNSEQGWNKGQEWKGPLLCSVHMQV